MSKKDVIELSDTDPLKGVCLSLWSDNPEQIEMFKSLCYSNIPENQGWFHQCNSRDYQMFEMWTPKLESLILVGRSIAEQIGLPFECDIRKTTSNLGQTE